MGRHREPVTRRIELTEQEVREISDVIQYETLKFWRQQGFNQTAKGQYMKDAMQEVWAESLYYLHNLFDRSKGVKPSSYVKHNIRFILLRFLVKQKWMHKNNLYRGKEIVKMPREVGLRARVKYSLTKSKQAPLESILT